MFGSRSAPSFFSQSSDLHAYIATCGDLSSYPHPAILEAMETHAAMDTPLAPAIADSKNPVLSSQEQASFTNSSFVDDNGVVDLIHRITSTLHQSVVSACILYGFPGTDRRGDCFAAGKFEMFISAIAEYLGFKIIWSSQTDQQVMGPSCTSALLHLCSTRASHSIQTQ